MNCPPNTWNKITVQASAAITTVAVSADGVSVGTATRSDNSTTSLYGAQFASSSTAGTGEHYLIDDILAI